MKSLIVLLMSLAMSLLPAVAHCGKCAPPEPKEGCECTKKCSARGAVLKGEQTRIDLIVKGMHCGACSQKLHDALSSLDGVEVEKACHEQESVILNYKNGLIEPETILHKITKEGFLITGENISLNIKGMTCEGCEKGLTSKVKSIEGVQSVKKACYDSSTLNFSINKNACRNTILKKIQAAGYIIQE